MIRGKTPERGTSSNMTKTRKSKGKGKIDLETPEMYRDNVYGNPFNRADEGLDDDDFDRADDGDSFDGEQYRPDL